MDKECVMCHKIYNARVFSQKYCSQKCRLQLLRGKYQRVKDRGLNTSTIGTLSELRVAIDLLQKGYEVFRAISPASSCDLAVLRDSKLLKVEVTTGHYFQNGRLVAPTHKQDRYDVLAIVAPDGNEIIYEGEF